MLASKIIFVLLSAATTQGLRADSGASAESGTPSVGAIHNAMERAMEERLREHADMLPLQPMFCYKRSIPGNDKFQIAFQNKSNLPLAIQILNIFMILLSKNIENCVRN